MLTCTECGRESEQPLCKKCFKTGQAMTSNPTPATQPLTDEKLDALNALHSRANPYPEIRYKGYIRVDVDEDDAEFHSAMYENLPDLIAHIRADWRRIEELKKSLEIARAQRLTALSALQPDAAKENSK